MSLDKSLRRKGRLERRRNVLSRTERIERLKEEERWEEGESSAFGLPKVKPHIIVAPTALRKPEEEAGAEGAAEGEPEEEAAD
ncbi:MAG: small basic protein [Planctomycetota bacterium]